MAGYCDSRFKSIRRQTREVKVGHVGVGGNNPIRVQSMTTSLTQDVAATVEQTLRLAEAGCEIVRIPAPNKAAAQALREIHQKVRAAKVDVPLVADIHFLPSAAMEAIEHVEKVRVNPGNYADKKKFQILEYTDAQYEEELQRLYESFSPLVLRAKALGKSLRIGTNHGSLSDRLMNRYGDSPLGMVESALEFIRIAESHGFYDMVLSMKASNPKVMIEAYRLAVAKMEEENMHYPLHLGVTEAGEGEDARIKSAIGIGALLYDGLGDTIRVSLTEDPWFEIPVCQDIVRLAETIWKRSESLPGTEQAPEAIDFYQYNRREVAPLDLGKECAVSPLEPPRVIIPASHPLPEHTRIIIDLLAAHRKLRDSRVEGLLVQLESPDELRHLISLQSVLAPTIPFFVVQLAGHLVPEDLDDTVWSPNSKWVLTRRFEAGDADALERWLQYAAQHKLVFAIDSDAAFLRQVAPVIEQHATGNWMLTASHPAKDTHPLGTCRQIIHLAHEKGWKAPFWVRFTGEMSIEPSTAYGQQLLDGAMLTGPQFADGFGDLLSVEVQPDMARATALAYNILQGCRSRASKTEYVACPSCGRTLFDLQSTTQKIKSRTGHLKGVTIAVMGCIVNGPGEMADADFGYVGGAPKKVNLYVGKTCVEYNIPEEEALDRLVALIQSKGKWVEPQPDNEPETANA